MGKYKNNTQQSPAAAHHLGFLNDVAGMGNDAVSVEERAVPYLRILQPLSPQVDKGENEYVEGAEPGMFLNTVTNRVYGAEISLIPIYFKSIWLEWKPERGGLVGRHEPGTILVDKTDFTDWTYVNPITGVKNTIQDTFMFFVLDADHIGDGPMIFSMTSSGIKHAKNWNTSILLSKLPDTGNDAPYFGYVWKISLAKYKKDQHTYYQIGGKSSNIEQIRLITKQEFIEHVKPTYDDIAKIEARVDFTQLQDSGETQVITNGEEGAF